MCWAQDQPDEEQLGYIANNLGKCYNLNVIGPNKLRGSGTSRKCGFVAVGMTL